MGSSQRSSLSALATSDLLDSLLGSLATGGLALLGTFGLLGLELLGLALLDFLGGSVGLLVSLLACLGLLSADLFDRQTNDGLLDAGRLARPLLLNIVNFNLLVIGSPGKGPSELNGLDLLVVQAAGLGRDEIVDPTVLRDEAATASRHDFVFRVRARLSLSNHF